VGIKALALIDDVLLKAHFHNFGMSSMIGSASDELIFRYQAVPGVSHKSKFEIGFEKLSGHEPFRHIDVVVLSKGVFFVVLLRSEEPALDLGPVIRGFYQTQGLQGVTNTTSSCLSDMDKDKLM
jgi:hypothetical protein